MSDPLAPDEQLRLATLYEIDLLDTPDEPVFDRVTRLVAALLNVPVAAVSLIDDDRQWLKSRVGNPPRESPRNESFCTHTITSKAPLIVEDARIDERFANSPLVNASHGTRFYAGIPLFSSLGLPLGALCAIDTKPRTLNHHELAAMQDLAAILIDEIHLRERLVAEKKKARESQQALSALHRSMESQIERRTRELNLVIESAYDAYVSLDTKGVVLDWNRAAETMFGWSRKNALAQPITALIFPEGLLTNDEVTPLVCNARRYDGSELSVEVRVKSLIIDGNKRFSLFIHDITERQQLERLRDKEAREDVLTQLPNRRALNERLPEAIARMQRLQHHMAVLFLDLDGFKTVNDQYGHAMGDALLRVVAKRLKAAVRETDYVARWAGDEFVILLESMALDAIQPTVQGLVDTVAKSIKVGEVMLHISTSIGVAVYLPNTGQAAHELLNNADAAMYKAKHAGKAQVYIAEGPNAVGPQILKDDYD